MANDRLYLTCTCGESVCIARYFPYNMCVPPCYEGKAEEFVTLLDEFFEKHLYEEHQHFDVDLENHPFRLTTDNGK